MSTLGKIGFLEAEMAIRTEILKELTEMFGISKAKELGGMW